MPDFDVAALSLASPPASAPVDSYRPAVLVRNLGIETAAVSGSLRIYDQATGLLLDTKQLQPTTIAAGTSKQVPASTLFEPTVADIGRRFIFMGTVDYAKDQNLANNNLAPTTVLIVSGEPTPPTPVEPHASQHEEGGGDQLSIEGLEGKAADAQTPDAHAATHAVDGTDPIAATPPLAHASTHEVGGSDPIEGIGPAAHASTHENGGDDELSVAGLSGLLADAQTPATHSSSAHDTTVEKTASKGQANGYAGLDTQATVPAAQLGTDATPDPLEPGLLSAAASTGIRSWKTRASLGLEQTSNKNAVSGYAGLDADAKIEFAQITYNTAMINAQALNLGFGNTPVAAPSEVLLAEFLQVSASTSSALAMAFGSVECAPDFPGVIRLEFILAYQLGATEFRSNPQYVELTPRHAGSTAHTVPFSLFHARATGVGIISAIRLYCKNTGDTAVTVRGGELTVLQMV